MGLDNYRTGDFALLGDLSITGSISASTLSGDGYGLTNIDPDSHIHVDYSSTAHIHDGFYVPVTGGTFTGGVTGTDLFMTNSITSHSATDHANIVLKSDAAKDQTIKFVRTATTHGWVIGSDNSYNVFGINYQASEDPILDANNFFTIDTVGKVGIGIPEPTYNLHVQNTGTVRNYIESTDSGQASTDLRSGAKHSRMICDSSYI
jgi:hypothetical protein